jgi:hypothetical protein
MIQVGAMHGRPLIQVESRTNNIKHGLDMDDDSDEAYEEEQRSMWDAFDKEIAEAPAGVSRSFPPLDATAPVEGARVQVRPRSPIRSKEKATRQSLLLPLPEAAAAQSFLLPSFPSLDNEELSDNVEKDAPTSKEESNEGCTDSNLKGGCKAKARHVQLPTSEDALDAGSEHDDDAQRGSILKFLRSGEGPVPRGSKRFRRSKGKEDADAPRRKRPTKPAGRAASGQPSTSRVAMDLTRSSEDEEEDADAEVPMLRSHASLDRGKRTLAFHGTQPPPPRKKVSGNACPDGEHLHAHLADTVWGGWGGSAARRNAGMMNAAEALSNVSVASSLAMAASHTPGRSSTRGSGGGAAGAADRGAGGSAGSSRSGAAGGMQAGAADRGAGGSADAGAQPRFAPRELVTLLQTEHDVHEFMHLVNSNLWIVSETEPHSNIMVVVYQLGKLARSIEVPINMLQQSDSPLPLPRSCKNFIDNFFMQAQKLAEFSLLAKQKKKKVDAIAATPDHRLISRANSRVVVKPIVPAYRGEPDGARELFQKKLAGMEGDHDAFPPGMPDEEPSRELQEAAAAEAAARKAAAAASDAIIARTNEELALAKTEMRAATLATRRLLEEQRRREVRQSEEEGTRLLLSLFNADERNDARNARNDARAEQAQERQSRQQQDEQLKRDKQRRTSPAFLIHLISQVTSVEGERQNNNLRSFKLDLMAKIAKWADGKTFFKMDGQWVRIVQFEISCIMQGLTMLDHAFKYASLNMTDAHTPAQAAHAEVQQAPQTPQGGTEPTPLPADRLIIVARDRQALDNARLLVDRFDEDGNIERVLVLNRRLVKEVKATKKRPMPAQVDDLNPHGRPPQETYNFTELLNVHAAGASALAVHATEGAVDVELEAATGCISPSLLRSLSMHVGEPSTTPVDDDSVLARVSDIVLEDQQMLISLGGIESTANDIAAGSAVGAEAFVEISGAVKAHLHTSTFISLMMDVARARQVLNILPETVQLNPEQLTAIFRERHLSLHADKNVGRSKEWQEEADETLAQVGAACNLLRKHYHSTRHLSYRVADTSQPAVATHPAVAAGSTEETAAASREHPIIEDIPMPTAPTRMLTMAAPELIAWCDQHKLDYTGLMFSRWNQELGK